MSTVKLSDYVAGFLASQGITHAFAIAGGASLHLIHSIARHPGIDYVCPHHEQAAAMAADGYARARHGLGVAIATSGPGATNLITGICCSYFDSIPVLYMTGQVSTFRFKGNSGIRQMGFQETDIVEICRPITKYATLLEAPERIRYELQKAVWIARSGRPGPVLIDIPDNLQRAMIDPAGLEGFTPTPAPAIVPAAADLTQLIERLKASQRPIAILGWGIELAGARNEAIEFLARSGVPYAPTWAMLDLLPHGHPLCAGPFGTHGLRGGNFAVQNADLVISIGARLDTHEIGSPPGDFARAAHKFIVDIDPAEAGKFARFGPAADHVLTADAGDFLRAANAALEGVSLPDYADWRLRIADWKLRYPAARPECRQKPTLDPYLFIKALSDAAPPASFVVVDTGCAVAWMSQAFEFKQGQRYFHAFNNTPMGYALPASVGASLANGKARVICVAGDGALQMNIQELATVAYHRLPIKIFVFNNRGYGMIQQTQDQWLESEYIASSAEGGLGFPNFVAVATAYGIEAMNIHTIEEACQHFPKILLEDTPFLVNVEFSPSERVIPQVKYGRPIEDAEPLLERSEFFADMIVPPLPCSLQDV